MKIIWKKAPKGRRSGPVKFSDEGTRGSGLRDLEVLKGVVVHKIMIERRWGKGKSLFGALRKTFVFFRGASAGIINIAMLFGGSNLATTRAGGT